jgi:hypothetical protein
MFNNLDNTNNNAIIIDTNSNKSNNKKRKINCVICFPKVELVYINPEERRYKCPRCKNEYQLGYEILPQEDELESSHSDYEEDSDSVGLLVADDDDFDNEDIEEEEEEDSIPIPDYMKPGPGQTLVEYREE